jgi:HEAT repeat protein
MGLEQRDRMVMALLESYQIGKTRYHAILYSIMEGLEDYNNPQMKPLFIEVSKTEGFPKGLRIKAIQSLANFNDESVLNDLIEMLDNKANYEFYYEISSLAEKINANQSYINKIRQAGLNAMKNK